ncbi:hypothetical protein GR211_33260 [Rhizobium leguminosarum]|uniref:hypothetical protein n=1 Tax=Rhizobium ruizarguesonis TaxID=2081791 RepID=UPI0013B9C92B|nr:hypothetical protein [Rhizobium ruizarguesonis]NEJ17718.1 hypothetical protein [Rhizobium ruizarguesonis]NEK31696.1 hypothetical protein [Rhizobium ruizarguesonis]
MPAINVKLYNLATSMNVDGFQIQDNNNGGASWSVNVRGGDEYPFQAQADEQNYGDLTITRIESGVPNHFSFVRDGDVLRV